jgi:hypothetical protein
MGRIDQLLERFKRHLELPLRSNLPLSQRVWFLVYPPDEERRLANRTMDFQIAVEQAKLQWRHISFGNAFADWMDTFGPEEKEACFATPDVIENYADPGFCDYLCTRIQKEVASVAPDERNRTVFAVSGLMELFDYIHVSNILDKLDDIPGILAFFFPGERDGNTYRFLGARTGWNYLAVPILAEG